MIIFLDECDHDEDLQERYKRENCISDVDFGKEDSENVSQVDILAYQKYCKPNYSLFLLKLFLISSLRNVFTQNILAYFKSRVLFFIFFNVVIP